ncbi:hypothetical protein Hrd1104_00135 [Halorhabdus sp. CBA1104]|uniref:DUF6339 family protein n=1 Tax=Halorhabdus sp. CBA1104 TaxID=1380432 RepID=UPI0012B1A45B|nr:DUF6339 family protein [Halorhabdus sp. CBA1104]QGN05853.1 hypothetical protein Hrd1104_00135 [Halorhabdus sp. CBA1104]
MARLYELTVNGRKDVDDESFLFGGEDYDEEWARRHRKETELRADLDRVEEKLEEAMDKYDPEDEETEGIEKIDQFVAPTIHDAINITPREAAREGIWHYLAVVEFPEFVRHRWPPDATQRTRQSMKEKFLGRHRDVYSNAFHRLWWIAELTHNSNLDDEYRRTVEALETQRLANTIFDRDFHRSPEVVQACVEALAGESNDVIEQVTYRINHGFSAVSLEAMSQTEIQDRVETIRDEIVYRD